MEKKIYKILKEEFEISEPLSKETNLVNDLGFESISLVDLASILAKETGIRVSQSDAIQWTTIESVLKSLS